MKRGLLITIEGLDGAGKSTLATSLRAALLRRGLTVRLLREPGGVEVSERIRALVKDSTLEIGARAEALLYAAARAQLVEQALEPLLSDGVIVLLDRFVDSSLAYQGAGRALGVGAIAEINAFATAGVTPDRTLLLELDPVTGSTRLAARGEEADRLERESTEFFERVRAGYDRLAANEPSRIVRIDAGAPPETVLDAALAAIDDLFAQSE